MRCASLCAKRPTTSTLSKPDNNNKRLAMIEKSTAREYNWHLPMKTNPFYHLTTEGRGALPHLVPSQNSA